MLITTYLATSRGRIGWVGMPVPILNDPKLCQDRAEQARQIAAEAGDVSLWEIMVELAEEYEEMARELEGNSQGS